MVIRKYSNQNNEPDQKKFELPSEKEHLFQVVDVFTSDDEVGKKLGLDADTVSVKCEVVGGDEEGRTLLNRLTLDDKNKGFFATRFFLKSISEPYKGDEFPIDSDNWVGKQFYANVIHNGQYANIKNYNLQKLVEQNSVVKSNDNKPEQEIAWDE